MDPRSWLVKHFETDDGDLLREMTKTFADALLSVAGAGALRCRLRRGLDRSSPTPSP